MCAPKEGRMLENEIQMALDISNILKSVAGNSVRWQQLSKIEWAKNTCGELKERLNKEYDKLYHEEYKSKLS